MRSFCSVLSAAALLGAAYGVDGAEQKGSATRANCLTAFNVVREHADLDPFTLENDTTKTIPITDENYIKAVCNSIQQGTPMSKKEASLSRTGTYAYAPHVQASDGCSSAVRYWKGAHENFVGLPPVYKNDNEGVYNDIRNRSFVALFNPRDDATIDCAFITCPVPVTTTSTASTKTETTTTSETTVHPEEQPTASASGDAGTAAHTAMEGQGREQPTAPFAFPVSYDTPSHVQGGPSVRRLSEPEATMTSLVCITNPAALVAEQRPFKEDDWEDIKESIRNSASAPASSVLLAAALLVFTSFIIL